LLRALIVVTAAARLAAAQTSVSEDRARLERQFEELMTGASLVGHFVVSVPGRETPPQDENYRVNEIRKVEGGRWLFNAQMKFGGRDVTLPMIFKVEWAGDTPVITVTDQELPGLGTFTARVLIYGDRYAGTWQHGKAGGHMWGRLERSK